MGSKGVGGVFWDRGIDRIFSRGSDIAEGKICLGRAGEELYFGVLCTDFG